MIVRRRWGPQGDDELVYFIVIATKYSNSPHKISFWHKICSHLAVYSLERWQFATNYKQRGKWGYVPYIRKITQILWNKKSFFILSPNTTQAPFQCLIISGLWCKNVQIYLLGDIIPPGGNSNLHSLNQWQIGISEGVDWIQRITILMTFFMNRLICSKFDDIFHLTFFYQQINMTKVWRYFQLTFVSTD